MGIEELIGPLPEGWAYSTLGETCANGGGDVQTGPFGSQLHAADYVPVGIPSIMPRNIGDNRIVVDDIARITEQDAIRLSRYRVRVGDIVYSRRGDVERRALIRAEEDGWLCGTGCLRIRLGNGVDPRYASYYLGDERVREWIVRHAHGATMLNLNTSILSDLPLAVPPSHQQKGIGEVLGILDDKIELNRRTNESLGAIARTMFRDWFVDFGPVLAKAQALPPYLVPDLWALFPDKLDSHGIPVGWKKAALLEHAKLISGGTPKTETADYWNGEIAWASAKDVSQCSDAFLMESERKITESGLENSSTKIISRLSTVVVARGATTGRYCMFGRDMAMNQTCYAVQNTERPFWLYLTFARLVGDLVHSAHGSVFDTITTRTFENASIVVANEPVLGAFEEFVKPLFLKILSNVQESYTLAQLRDFLLPQLISGAIRVGDTEKEVERAL